MTETLTLDAFLASLGFPTLHQPALFELAFTHSSYGYENGGDLLNNYERLEFLGDAVLKVIVSELLYEQFPQYREGELTQIRSVLVSDATLAELATELNLGHYIRFGVSEQNSNGKLKRSNLACVFEALLGALYLDGQFVPLHAFLKRLFAERILHIDANKRQHNYKATLQEFTQAHGLGLPSYNVVRTTGPAHDCTFYIAVDIAGQAYGEGQGQTKKEAEQDAARLALDALR
jgi:ribonuclease-3